MIFKTFDSKIDKWTSKIGVFGKSFNELGTAVNNAFKSAIDNLDNFDENVGFWESLKNNLFSKKNANKDWLKNSLGNIISKDNIDSYIKELDLDSAKEKLADIFDWEDLVKNGNATWGEYFDTLKDGTEKYIPDLIRNTDDLSKLTGEDLVKANQQARASALAHNEAIKAQTFSAKAGKVALQALAMAGNMFIMYGVTKLIEGFHEMASASKEFANSAADIGQSLSSTQSDLESYEKETQELWTTINDSSSSFDETKAARERLMGIQNELIDKFGDEKDAIDFITESIKEGTSAFDDFAKAQYKASMNEFINDNSGFWKKMSYKSNGYNSVKDQMIDTMENYYASFASISLLQKELGDRFDSIVKSNNIEAVFDNNGNITGLRGDIDDVTKALYRMQDAVEDNKSSMNPEYYNRLNESLATQTTEITETANKYRDLYDQYVLYEKVFSNEGYTNSFNKIREEYKKYQEAFASGDDDVIETAKQSFAEIVQSATEGVTDDSVVDFFKQMYPDLQAEVEKWEFHAKILPQFDTRALNGKTKSDILQMLQEDGLQYGEQTFNSTLRLASEYGIITGTNAEKVQQLLDLLVEWGILQDDINDTTSAYEVGTPTLSISETVTQLNTKLKPAMDSLKSAWQDMFDDDGKFDLKSIDILSTCDSIKSKLDEMSDPEGLNLDVDYSSFEDFVRVLSNTESTQQDVEKAMDSLADSITEAALSGTEDFETMKSVLENLGLENSELVAFDALISNTKALKEAGLDLANASDAQIQAFANESVSAENATQAYNMLAFHKELCNLQKMNTAGEVANLKTLAENAGYTGEVIQYLTELEQIYQEVASGTLTAGQLVAKVGRAAILKGMIDNAASKVQYAPKVDWSGAVKDAGKAGKDSGKSYKDKLKEELSDLEGVISGITGRIDDQISSINEQKSAALESIDAQKEALEEAKDAAVEALEAQRDAELEAIEAEKNAINEKIKALDKQIKQKQDEIDAINEAAEARKREIDLQKAQYELERMQNMRTKLVNYMPDTIVI